MKRVSRNFAAFLAGFGITLLAWFTSWSWTAWPAFTVLHLAFPQGGFGPLSYGAPGAVIVGLIILNIAFWGVLAWLLTYALSFITGSRGASCSCPRTPARRAS